METNVLDTLELEVQPDILEQVEQAEQEVVVPSITDPTWHDYVMSKFREDEMKENNPTTDGLRRVSQLLLGRIVGSETQIACAANDGNSNRATVIVTVSFFDGEMRSNFSGAADSSPDNTDDVYRRYPTAIAESRAEGRALRKALNLRKVVAAEELSLIARGDSSMGGLVKIENAQIKGIDIMCKRHNINVLKFINIGSKQYNSISEVDFDYAIKMMQELNRYQADAGNPDFKEVPDAVRGYDPNWNVKE